MQGRADSAQLQRISHQLSGLMASLADVEKLALALQADAAASRKVLSDVSCLHVQLLLRAIPYV